MPELDKAPPRTPFAEQDRKRYEKGAEKHGHLCEKGANIEPQSMQQRSNILVKSIAEKKKGMKFQVFSIAKTSSEGIHISTCCKVSARGGQIFAKCLERK